MSIEHRLEIARTLALEAGTLVRRHQAGRIEVNHKANGEVVTAADREADALLRAGLQQEFPEDAIFSEEAADSRLRLLSRHVWIVDPIDSTSNFAAGGDEYVVSVGLAIDGRPALGVVYNPVRDELFAGAPGIGTTLNGAAVHVSGVRQIEEASLLVSRKEWQRGLAALDSALPIRPVASMAYKLARVAAGLDDGVFSAKRRKEWGTCAGVALVLAAGGRATLLDGSPIAFNRAESRQSMGMVAAGPALHDCLLHALPQLLEEVRQ